MAEPAQVAEYLSAPYSRVLVPDPSGGYFAEVLELPGCFSEGDTPEEAIKNVEEAMEGWIAAALDAGQAIPSPAASRGYSGHVALRMPKSLHREAVRRAELEGVSLNQYLVTAIEAHVAGQDMADEIAARVAAGLQARFTQIIFTQADLKVAFNVPGLPMEAVKLPAEELVEPNVANYAVTGPIARRERQNA
ncbi:MAG: type II toxin-antitoxin system HicB family antitoxin [Chloroflexota bacterium]|nr:type II toxin-antitoxin system HicB family antitoxin [Chloroflexota bacterium]